MNALQQAMEAIRQAITVMEIDTPNSDVLDLCYKSLSECEAELRREPDAVYLGSESEYGGDLIRLDVDISVGTELFIRGETK